MNIATEKIFSAPNIFEISTDSIKSFIPNLVIDLFSSFMKSIEFVKLIVLIICLFICFSIQFNSVKKSLIVNLFFYFYILLTNSEKIKMTIKAADAYIWSFFLNNNVEIPIKNYTLGFLFVSLTVASILYIIIKNPQIVPKIIFFFFVFKCVEIFFMKFLKDTPEIYHLLTAVILFSLAHRLKMESLYNVNDFEVIMIGVSLFLAYFSFKLDFSQEYLQFISNFVNLRTETLYSSFLYLIVGCAYFIFDFSHVITNWMVYIVKFITLKS